MTLTNVDVVLVSLLLTLLPVFIFCFYLPVSMLFLKRTHCCGSEAIFQFWGKHSEKHRRWSSYLVKFRPLACNLIKIELRHDVYVEHFQNLQDTWMLLPVTVLQVVLSKN